jgi:hypothetical protein
LAVALGISVAGLGMAPVAIELLLRNTWLTNTALKARMDKLYRSGRVKFRVDMGGVFLGLRNDVYHPRLTLNAEYLLSLS